MTFAVGRALNRAWLLRQAEPQWDKLQRELIRALVLGPLVGSVQEPYVLGIGARLQVRLSLGFGALVPSAHPSSAGREEQGFEAHRRALVQLLSHKGHRLFRPTSKLISKWWRVPFWSIVELQSAAGAVAAATNVSAEPGVSLLRC